MLWVAVLVAALNGCGRGAAVEQSYRTALAYFQEKKYAKAAEYLEQAVAAVPEHAPAWNFLGVCQLECGQTEAGLQSLARAVQLNPQYIAAHYNLGVAYLEHNQADAAITHLRQAAQADTAPADVLLHLGRAYKLAGALLQAEQTLTRHLTQHPDAIAFNELGIIHVWQRNYLRAEEAFRRSVAADPRFAPALHNLAWLEHHHLGRLRDAITHYQQYLDLLPKHQPREDLRLTIVQLEKELASAAKSQEMAAVVAPVQVKPARPVPPSPPPPPAPPTPPTVITAPAPPAAPEKKEEVVLVTTPQPPPPPLKKQRIPVATQAPAAGSRTKAAPLFNEGVKLQQQRNPLGAIAAYSKAVATDPSFAAAHYNLAIAYRETGQLEKALDHYEYALLADPKYTDARYNYALLLQQQGYTEDAARQFEEILKTHPKDAGLHLSLATIYARDRATVAQARDHYQTYLKLQPNSPLAREIRDWLEKNR